MAPPDERVIGRYRVVVLIGRGGMAEVYRAHDPQLDRDVAIKLILPSFADESGFVERFQTEARAVARLRHPNIVQVWDFDLDKDHPYMVMEFIPGATLKDRLTSLRRQGQRMAIEQVARVVGAIGSALDHAHAQGMVHRDVKPSNILFAQDDTPVLADFGIVQIVGETQHTTTSSVSGTPSYMAPEQAAGRTQPSSDVYSLGVVLFEMLVGRTPFTAATPAEMMLKHREEVPPSVLASRPDLPPAVAPIVARALAKDPAQRFPSAAELSLALRGALAGAAVDPAGIVAAPQAVRQADPAAPPGRPAEPARDSPTVREDNPSDPSLHAAAPNKDASEATGGNLAGPIRKMAELLSLAALLAPLVGRKVPQSRPAEGRRGLIASGMAVTGVLLAVLDFFVKSFELVEKLLNPFSLMILPYVAFTLGVLGVLLLFRVVRITTSKRIRRNALALLTLTAVLAVGWGGWTVYHRVKPPDGPLILIADFERSCKNCDEIDWGRRLYQGVRGQIDRLKLTGVDLRRTLEPYPDSQAAQAKAAAQKATLIVWGWYDAKGASPHFELLRPPTQTSMASILPVEEMRSIDFYLQEGERETSYIVLLVLGLARYSESDFAAALRLFDHAIGVQPSDERYLSPEGSYFYRASARFQAGEPVQGVIDDLKTALRLRPTMSEAHHNLAIAYQDACTPEGGSALELALAASEQAVKLSGSAAHHFVHGVILRDLGRSAESIKAFQSSIDERRKAHEEEEPDAHGYLEEAYRAIGDQAQAKRESELARKAPATKARNELGGLTNEADALFYMGSLPEAEQAYRKALNRAAQLQAIPVQISYLQYGLALTLRGQKRWTDAATALERAVALGGPVAQRGTTFAILGDIRQNLGSFDAAETAYKKALELRPCDADIRLSLAHLYESSRRIKDAVEQYRALLGHDRYAGLGYHGIAFAQAAAGNYAAAGQNLERALPLLKSALDKAPTDGRLLRAYAGALMQTEQTEGALAMYRKVVEVDPSDVTAWMAIGQMLWSLGRYAEAEPALRRALELDPGHVAGHRKLAEVYIPLHRFDDAVAEYRAVARLAPDNADDMIQLAFALYFAGKPGQALPEAERAAKLAPDNPASQYVLGLVCKANGDRARAVEALEKVVQHPKATEQMKQAAAQALKMPT